MDADIKLFRYNIPYRFQYLLYDQFILRQIVKFESMKKSLFIIACMLISYFGSGQVNTITQSKAYKKIILSENKDIWRVTLQNMEMPTPDGDSEKDKLLKLKNELALKYPRKQHSNHSNKSIDSLPTIIIENGFE